MSGTPSQRSPAGVPSGGNAKYAIVVVLLLLGLGAIVAYMKFGKSEQQAVVPPPPPPSTSVAVTPTNPMLDNVPAPPPEEPKPEAGTTSRPQGTVAMTGTGGCEGKCAGVAGSDTERALQMIGASARRCYNAALNSDPTLKGNVTVAVRISPSGQVCGASVAANDMGTPLVAQCVAGRFRAAGSVPPPKGGCVDATVPMHFVPAGGQ